MLGDNKSVVDSSTIPHAKLHKCHNALSFHQVREAIAGAIIGFYHIDGNGNPADILSKHWGCRQLLQPLLLWRGDTKDIDVLDLYKAHPGSVVDFKQKGSDKNHTRMTYHLVCSLCFILILQEE